MEKALSSSVADKCPRPPVGPMAVTFGSMFVGPAARSAVDATASDAGLIAENLNSVTKSCRNDK
jgi:hypothetical protein